MPLSEFLRLARLRGNLEPSQLNEPFPRADDGLMELVWENGQIVMQGQSSNKASNAPRANGPALLQQAPSKVPKFSEVESILDDISPVVPSNALDLMTQDDDLIRWLNCPLEDPLHQDYCSDLLPEISGATATHNSLLPTTDGRTFGGDCHGGNSTMKASSSSSKPCLGSAVLSGVVTNNNPSSSQGVVASATPARGKTVVNDSTNRQNSTRADLMNFSHFSKPAFLAKPNPPNSAAAAPLPPNVAPSLPIKKSGFFSKEGVVVKSLQPMVKRSEGTSALRREASDVNEKVAEAVVVTSSVGSGNSADRLSYGQTQNSKRKFHDVDDSECRSDDVETESVGAKKQSNGRGGSGSKRSRAAEVHNLSERRRRDRINEKMRALQELIPNCNKADKASMLDEAIEYLKTLQLQVQMMSMGAGLCMPQMMYPHPTHHFPPLMGMGMGYGIGGSHMFHPLNSVQGPHFPRIPHCPNNMAGYGNLGQGMPSSVLPRPPQPPLVHTPMSHASNNNNSNTSASTSHLNLNSSVRSGGVACSSSLPSNNVSSQQQKVATSEGMMNESMKAVQENEQTTFRVHTSKNDNSKLCIPSSAELNDKEEAGCS